jgi:UDP-glucuronate 4-epimerase
VSLADLVHTVEEVCGRAAVIERLPMQPGDVDRTWADISRARALLGFDPAVGIREGIERQWEWMRAERG